MEFRFVWRNTQGSRWYPVVLKADTQVEAIESMRKHLCDRVGKRLQRVVVDHFFYWREAGKSPVETHDADKAPWEPLSLRHVELQPFFVQFGDQVLPPGSR